MYCADDKRLNITFNGKILSGKFDRIISNIVVTITLYNINNNYNIGQVYARCAIEKMLWNFIKILF